VVCLFGSLLLGRRRCRKRNNSAWKSRASVCTDRCRSSIIGILVSTSHSDNHRRNQGSTENYLNSASYVLMWREVMKEVGKGKNEKGGEFFEESEGDSDP